MDPRLKVRALLRRREAAESLSRLGAEVAHVDLGSVERMPLAKNKPLLAALEGVDRMFLLTGYSVGMLAQSKALVDAAKLSGVKHIVHVGAWANDDTTIAHLGWHQFVERYIECSSIHYTHLRPNSFMQNVLKFSFLQPGGVIYDYMGDRPQSWIDCEDVASVAATVLRAPEQYHGRTIPLAVEALTVSELATVISRAVGAPCRVEPCSPDVWLRRVLAAGMEASYADCVHNYFNRVANRALEDADDVFDTVQAIVGRPPNTWQAFASKHREDFLSVITARPT
jgi:uncharacterized protein YbjT (DUF2867 family)